MIIKYSSLVGSQIAELKDQTRLGTVSEVVIDTEKISIAAIALQQSFLLFTKNKFALSMDIVYLLKNGVIIRDAESLVDLKESISVENLVKEKSFGIGQKVVTNSGGQLGRVYDFIVDSETLSITKFYVKQLMHDRIIPVEKIVSMTGRTIIVKDDYASGRIQAAMAPESASVSS